jgi:hypothetical protein
MIYEPVEDYETLLNGLGRISKGRFNTHDIHITDADIYQPNFTISFNLGDDRYTIPLEYRGDYINWDFMESINEILMQQDKSGMFHVLRTDDQTAPIIFLDDHQFQLARKWNFFGLGSKVVAERGLGRSP